MKLWVVSIIFPLRTESHLLFVLVFVFVLLLSLFVSDLPYFCLCHKYLSASVSFIFWGFHGYVSHVKLSCVSTLFSVFLTWFFLFFPILVFISIICLHFQLFLFCFNWRVTPFFSKLLFVYVPWCIFNIILFFSLSLLLLFHLSLLRLAFTNILC